MKLCCSLSTSIATLINNFTLTHLKNYRTLSSTKIRYSNNAENNLHAIWVIFPAKFNNSSSCIVCFICNYDEQHTVYKYWKVPHWLKHDSVITMSLVQSIICVQTVMWHSFGMWSGSDRQKNVLFLVKPVWNYNYVLFWQSDELFGSIVGIFCTYKM